MRWASLDINEKGVDISEKGGVDIAEKRVGVYFGTWGCNDAMDTLSLSHSYLLSLIFPPNAQTSA